MRVYEEEAAISFATLLDIEGNTDEAIAKLEKLNSILSNWHLAKVTVLSRWTTVTLVQLQR